MLQKKAVILKVNKLRAILFMKVDFNFRNKLIFGKRMVEKLEKNNMLPLEQFESIELLCNSIFLNQRLIADLD